MPTAMLMAWPEATKEQYDQVMDHLGLDENPPEGALFHVAGVEGGTLRVLDLWESEAAWNRFLETRLQPAAQAVGLEGQPDVRLYPVHNVYTPAIEELRRIGSSALAGATV
jgi:hypothetical protein